MKTELGPILCVKKQCAGGAGYFRDVIRGERRVVFILSNGGGGGGCGGGGGGGGGGRGGGTSVGLSRMQMSLLIKGKLIWKRVLPTSLIPDDFFVRFHFSFSSNFSFSFSFSFYLQTKTPVGQNDSFARIYFGHCITSYAYSIHFQALICFTF